ncbi:hypothetical protein MFM001_24560 [Mycobacterium sp. MFM001]|uniref:hypothetical protein n=1 Tax=Mycobacterium sp. MFM001 TaxID=2049453 RepID=UPI000DA5D85E|nr:hypothetical protein [Mycobacterium sp. MFM001]GBE65994.1 hypothetical protein MFM001_24560 [Mycobacterium sp. MFM001]
MTDTIVISDPYRMPITAQRLVRKYSFVAARFEQMRLAQHDRTTTPDDDARFREVTEMLSALAKKLGLGDSVNGFLPGDPQRIFNDSSLECARLWFQ